MLARLHRNASVYDQGDEYLRHTCESRPDVGSFVLCGVLGQGAEETTFNRVRHRKSHRGIDEEQERESTTRVGWR